MEKRIEDLKETAPCGMLIHYTVNEEDMSRTYTYNGKEYVNLIPLCEACHNEQHPDKRVKTEFKKEHFVNEERW